MTVQIYTVYVRYHLGDSDKFAVRSAIKPAIAASGDGSFYSIGKHLIFSAKNVSSIYVEDISEEPEAPGFFEQTESTLRGLFDGTIEAPERGFHFSNPVQASTGEWYRVSLDAERMTDRDGTAR